MTLHPVWYVLLVILGLGIAGMAIGSRGKPADVQRERWLKTLSFGAIVALLMFLAQRGDWLVAATGGAVAAGGAVELGRAMLGPPRGDRALNGYRACAALLYLALCAGFLRFLLFASSSAIVFVFLAVFCFDAFSQVTGRYSAAIGSPRRSARTRRSRDFSAGWPRRSRRRGWHRAGPTSRPGRPGAR